MRGERLFATKLLLLRLVPTDQRSELAGEPLRIPLSPFLSVMDYVVGEIRLSHHPVWVPNHSVVHGGMTPFRPVGPVGPSKSIRFGFSTCRSWQGPHG